MAGARVEIIKDTARPALRRMLGRLQGDDRDLLYGHMGEYLVRSTRERAAKEVDPQGRPWRALSPRYKRYKDKKRPGVPKLKFDFHMLGDRFSWQIDGDSLLVGTSAPYGAIHQFGGAVHRAARSRLLSFGKDRENGMKRFAKTGSRDVDHQKWATVEAYDIKIPARPWLGVSADDDKELLDIAEDHLQGGSGGG